MPAEVVLQEIQGTQPGDVIRCRRAPGEPGAAALRLAIVREGKVLAVDADPADGHWHVLPRPTARGVGDLWAEGWEVLGTAGEGTVRLRLLVETEVPVDPADLEVFEIFDGQETHQVAARDLPEALQVAKDCDLITDELEGLSVARLSRSAAESQQVSRRDEGLPPCTMLEALEEATAPGLLASTVM